MTLRDYIMATWPDLAAAGNYPQIADLGNAPTTVANPVTEPAQVPVTITLKSLLALVPPAEAAKIYQLGGFMADLKQAIDAGDRVYLGYMLSVAQAAGTISAQTAAALAPLLTQTEADPAWSATVAGPSLFAAAGYGYVTPADVQAALNNG